MKLIHMLSVYTSPSPPLLTLPRPFPPFFPTPPPLPYTTLDRNPRSNKLRCRPRIDSVAQMRRQDNRLAVADKIAGGAESVDFARRDAGEGLVVVWVAEEDLFLVLVDGLGGKEEGGREGIREVGEGYEGRG
jgi:hypothetical protein